MANSSFFTGSGVGTQYIEDLDTITEEAKAHRDAAAVSATEAATDAAAINADINTAVSSASAAQLSAAAAANSAADTIGREVAAEASAAASEASAVSSDSSATAAEASKDTAVASAIGATASEIAAGTSASLASAKASDASTSEANAATSASNAAASETGAAAQATTAITKASEATTNADNSAASAASAASSVVSAAAESTAAASSATASASSATASATSATQSAVSAASIVGDVADAQAAATQALGYRDTTSLHKLAAEAAATSATSTAAALTGFDLEAIAATKAVTAVDVFVYDTSKDSDGGAWRKRTQGTSWYNETLNTATRGSRREFPAVAVIVVLDAADGSQVRIYDGDDPSLPMWMIITNVAGGAGHVGTKTSCYVLNGMLTFGVKETQGLRGLNFIDDTIFGYKNFYGGGATGISPNPIALRDEVVDVNDWSNDYPALVNANVNDVAMTVLPNAPIDAATGLPVPTIAVATAGGVSVIKDDGTVVDIVYFIYTGAYNLHFRDDKALVFNNGNNAGNANWTHVFQQIPSVDVSDGNGYVKGSADEFYSTNSAAYAADLAYLDAPSSSPDAMALNSWGKSNGLAVIDPNPVLPSSGMIALTTSTYNTGWMNGDIKGAFLSDTDDTDLVGGEFAAATTFDTDVTGVTPFSGATIEHDTGGDGGRLKVISDGTQYSGVFIEYASAIEAGKQYLFQIDYTTGTYAGIVGLSSNGQNTSPAPSFNTSGTYSAVLTSNYSGTASRQMRIRFDNVPAAGEYFFIDNISVKLLDADRSVNNKPLNINGTITRSPVATGADLVAYSGWRSVSGSAKYLYQPYNPDLNFGTGDFSLTFWIHDNGGGSTTALLQRKGAGGVGNGLYVWLTTSSSTRYLNFTVDNLTRNSGIALPSNAWTHVTLVRRDGVLNVYFNGAFMAGGTISSYDVVSDQPMFIGINALLSRSYSAIKLALLRISATAPTAEQIAKIYEDEKVLFQENAQATLYGSSDAVTALAHDDATGLLHVGTSAGRSVFQGLRRVENTTTAVGTAISASNGLVVEE